MLRSLNGLIYCDGVLCGDFYIEYEDAVGGVKDQISRTLYVDVYVDDRVVGYCVIEYVDKLLNYKKGMDIKRVEGVVVLE